MSTDTAVKQRNKISDKNQSPGKYKVVVYNDDVTPIEFVVSMLVRIFKHDEATALNLTLTIHNSGKAIVGVYNYEIAEQKSIEATNLARTNGYPLITKLEQE